MAKRKRKRRAYGKPPKGCSGLGGPTKAFMSWLNRARTGQLDHVFLREARKIARAPGFLPGDGTAKLEKKIKRAMLKKRLVCAIAPGKDRRSCAELSTFKPDYKKVAACYMTRINYGWKGKGD